jgi:hypothetical protein
MIFSNDEIRKANLLKWLADQGLGSHLVSAFYEDQENSFQLMRQDVKDLEAEGLVKPIFHGGGMIEAEATSQGRTHIEALLGARDDAAKRRWACRSSLVRWIDQKEAHHESESIVVKELLSDPRANFYGVAFDATELDRASEWLKNKGLVDGRIVEESAGPVQAFLTESGIECVEHFDGDVLQYVNSKERQTVGATVNVDAHNVQVSTGQGASQVMHIGATMDQLQLALAGLVEMIRAMDLIADDAELSRLQESATADLLNDKPTVASLERFVEWVQAKAIAGGNAAAAAAIIFMTNGLLTDASHLASGLMH